MPAIERLDRPQTDTPFARAGRIGPDLAAPPRESNYNESPIKVHVLDTPRHVVYNVNRPIRGAQQRTSVPTPPPPPRHTRQHTPPSSTHQCTPPTCPPTHPPPTHRPVTPRDAPQTPRVCPLTTPSSAPPPPALSSRQLDVGPSAATQVAPPPFAPAPAPAAAAWCHADAACRRPAAPTRASALPGPPSFDVPGPPPPHPPNPPPSAQALVGFAAPRRHRGGGPVSCACGAVPPLPRVSRVLLFFLFLAPLCAGPFCLFLFFGSCAPQRATPPPNHRPPLRVGVAARGWLRTAADALVQCFPPPLWSFMPTREPIVPFDPLLSAASREPAAAAPPVVRSRVQVITQGSGVEYVSF